jgi:adenosine deaminase
MAFQFAKSHNIHCTAHAGEARCRKCVGTLKNFHPSRIGHGVLSAEDEQLLSFLKENDIHLEVCPTSNIQVNVFDKIEDHTATRSKAGVL